MSKFLKTRCPHCNKTISFDKEYAHLNEFRNAIFFICNDCETIFFSDTYGGEPIAYYDNEKLVDIREEGYNDDGEWVYNNE